MAQYHYFYDLYKQKLHYQSAIKVGKALEPRNTNSKQYFMLSSQHPETQLDSYEQV